MPEITFEEASEFLKLLDFHSLHNEKQAEIDACNYINKNGITLEELTPSGIHFVISKLEGLKQANFIKDNIELILKDDEDIFIYSMMAPKSLPHYLNYTSLKVLHDVAPSIFDKILEDSFLAALENLTSEEIISFFSEFKDKIDKLENLRFIMNLSSIRYNRRNEEELIDIVKEMYKERINNLSGHDLLKYIEFIVENTEVASFIEENKDKVVEALSITDPNLLHTFLVELDSDTKKTALVGLTKDIINPNTLNKVISSCTLDSIVSLYNKDKELFKKIDIESLVKAGNKDFMCKAPLLSELLDSYKLDSIEFLNKTLYRSYFTSSLNLVASHIEKRFRDSLIIDGKLETIDDSTTIFSTSYLKNLKEIHELKLDSTSPIYMAHLKVFVKYLTGKEIIDIPNNDELKQLDIYFHRIIKGESLTKLVTLTSIQDIAMLNRHRKIEFNAEELSVNQIASYNIKEHKKLYSLYDGAPYYTKEYRALTLKLMLMLGYNRASYVLSIDKSLPTLEHLVGNVDVSDIKLDEQGNPILNKRFINIMFKDKDNPRIKEMLNDKTSPLYKYFPRIFNEWDIIKINHKDKNLDSIFEFLEGEDVHLPPKYYKLEKELKYVGCKGNIVSEAMALHDKMLKRVTSSIPRVKGKVNDYTYEVLRYDNLEGISVGNKTNCCFTVKGRAFTCLKHALASNNGRVLVIKKNGELIAHSWLWRNGNLLCIDNIEVNKGVKDPSFFEAYKEFVKEVINVSRKEEQSSSIKTITLGKSSFDFNIPELSSYMYMKDISLKEDPSSNSILVDALPQPIEYVSYSDSNKKQYILYGDTNYSLYSPETSYEDERIETYVYNSKIQINDETKEKIEKHLNYLRHLKETNNPDFSIVTLNSIETLYINTDYYIAINKKGEIESYILDNDYRAKEEYQRILSSLKKKVKSA